MATNITAITDSVNTSGHQGPRQFQGLFKAIPFKATLTDASLAAQVAGQCDLVVTGAALGDLVLVDGAIDRTGVMLDAYVSAANTVTITTWNVESTDANTTLSAGVVFKGVVLKPNDNVWGSLD